MCVCVHVCVHACVHAGVCVCVCVHACVCACMHVCVRACVRACMCVCVYACVCAWAFFVHVELCLFALLLASQLHVYIHSVFSLYTSTLKYFHWWYLSVTYLFSIQYLSQMLLLLLPALYSQALQHRLMRRHHHML